MTGLAVRCARARLPRGAPAPRPTASTPVGGDEKPRHGRRPLAARPPERATGSPSAASIARSLRRDAGDGLDELGVVAPAEPCRHLDHAGPTAPSRNCVYDGPSAIPSARDGPLGPATSASPRSLGQTCASATPNAGGSATIRSVTASAVNTPPAEKPTTVTSGPLRPALRRAPRRSARLAARARPPSRSSASSCTSESPFWPCWSGRLHDARRLDVGERILTADDQ